MSKRDPARHAELNRQKGRQLVLEARAAREMSRSGAVAQGPGAQAVSASEGARSETER